MKLKKDGSPKQSGGARQKPEENKKGKMVQFRPSPRVADILARQTNKTVFIECAILAYNVRLFEQQEVVLL